MIADERRPSANALEARFRAIFDALESGGILLFDVSTPGRSGPSRHRTVSWEHPGIFVHLDEREEVDPPSLVRTIDTFVASGDLYRRSREVHRLTVYDPDSVEASLHRTGFEVDRTTHVGDVELLPGWISFVATKPTKPT